MQPVRASRNTTRETAWLLVFFAWNLTAETSGTPYGCRGCCSGTECLLQAHAASGKRCSVRILAAMSDRDLWRSPLSNDTALEAPFHVSVAIFSRGRDVSPVKKHSVKIRQAVADGMHRQECASNVIFSQHTACPPLDTGLRPKAKVAMFGLRER